VRRSGGPILGSLLSSDYLVLLFSAAFFLALWPFTPGLASPENLRNIFSSMLPLLVLAVGQTFVLVTGGIDLSVTGIIPLASVVGGSIMAGGAGLLAGSPAAGPAGLAAMLAAGAAVGMLNGILVARTRMPAFIVTLTGQMFFGGLAVSYASWYSGGVDFHDLPPAFTDVTQGRIFGVVPSALAAAGLLAIGAHVVLSRTILGRWLYAIGGNATAAAISGVPVRRALVAAYVLSGLCAAAASVLYTGRLETASASHGQRVLLDVIAAAVIGGTSLFGGRGSIRGTLFGVLFITLLDNTLSYRGLSNFSVLMVKGVVILLAAIIDAARARILGGGRDS
jgi:ribose/xylose/arabinose/galactoside ABC-type transport system permease subunit